MTEPHVSNDIIDQLLVERSEAQKATRRTRAEEDAASLDLARAHTTFEAAKTAQNDAWDRLRKINSALNVLGARWGENEQTFYDEREGDDD